MKLNPNNPYDIAQARGTLSGKRKALPDSDLYGGDALDLAILLLDEQLEKLNGGRNDKN
ncbi:MAG: hypothetical protein RR335_09510 [Eubacterium sp.]